MKEKLRFLGMDVAHIHNQVVACRAARFRKPAIGEQEIDSPLDRVRNGFVSHD
jgi:hypothetical protein